MDLVTRLRLFGAQVIAYRQAEALQLGLSAAEALHYIRSGNLPQRLCLPAQSTGVADAPSAADNDDGVERLGDGRPILLSHAELLARMNAIEIRVD